MADEKSPSAARPRKQRAAAPKKPTRKPQTQRATIPGVPRPGQARQIPPLTPDLIEYFGGREMIDLIVAECVPDDASPGDILRLLLEARRLRADPLRRDVYLAREGSRDGAGLGYAVAARRDALLAFAERQPDFLGFDADAVYANDTYERVEPDGYGDTLRKRAGVVHKRAGIAEDDRGRLLFGWCAVEREYRPPLLFEARMAEYMPDEDLVALDPDDPRKRYANRWIVKVAMCWTLRELYGLSDVVGADELGKRPDPLPQAGQPIEPPIFWEGPVDSIDERILDAYRQAQALDVLLWPPAKVRAHLSGCESDTDRQEVAALIEADVQHETARRRDPVALKRRLAELRAFGTEDLDEDALREYQTELAAVKIAAIAAGVDVRPATA